jgi:hypothetical protein
MLVAENIAGRFTTYGNASRNVKVEQKTDGVVVVVVAVVKSFGKFAEIL